MIRGRLNPNEQLVLYGLVRYPLQNDRKLARSLNLKMTTLTAIKNRLKKQKYFTKTRIPVLEKLDTELFCIINIRFNSIIPEDELFKKLGLLISKAPEFFFVATEGGHAFGLAISRNYSDMIESIEKISYEARSNKLIENVGTPTEDLSFFPLKNSRIFNFFDFGPILSREFNLKFGDEPEILFPAPKATKTVQLTNIEKKVLFGLVNYPNLPDSKISEKVGVTRQVISKMKHTFEEDGLIQTKIVPDFKKLGFQILTFSTHNHNPTTPVDKRENGINLIMEEVPHILLVSSNLKSVMMCLCKNFQEFQILKTRALIYYKEHDFLLGEPNISMFSIPNLHIIINHVYGQIVKKVLEIEDIK
jgi:DNA-binding MarR family transcriptional regulator